MYRNATTLLPLLLLLCLLPLRTARAAHIVGGELMYECHEDSTYEFLLILYRDCANFGALFDSAPNANTTGTVTIYRGTELQETITLSEPLIYSISAQPCLQRGLYRFSVVLSPGEDYNIVYQRCCFSYTVANVADPGITGMTIRNTVDATVDCNHTPVFNAGPPWGLSLGEPFSFDLAATDADGDSLRYRLCPALSGGGPNTGPGFSNAPNGVAPDPDTNAPYDTVSLINPYTAANPFPTVNGLQLDPVTGVLSGVATAVGEYLISVCVEEYRNDVLIGTTQRVWQINATGTYVAVSDEATLFDDVAVWPNPVSGYLNLVNLPPTLEKRIDILALSGQLIRTEYIRENRLSTADLPSGVYLLRISAGAASITRKIVVL